MNWAADIVQRVAALPVAESAAVVVAVPFVIGGTHLAIWKQVSDSYQLVASASTKREKLHRLYAITSYHRSTLIVALLATITLVLIAVRPFATTDANGLPFPDKLIIDYYLTVFVTALIGCTFLVACGVAYTSTRFTKNDTRDLTLCMETVAYLTSGRAIKGGITDLNFLNGQERFSFRTADGVRTYVDSAQLEVMFLQSCPHPNHSIDDDLFVQSADKIVLSFPVTQVFEDVSYFTTDEFYVVRLGASTSNTSHLVARRRYVKILKTPKSKRGRKS